MIIPFLTVSVMERPYVQASWPSDMLNLYLDSSITAAVLTFAQDRPTVAPGHTACLISAGMRHSVFDFRDAAQRV
jgi:hypothetical protein